MKLKIKKGDRVQVISGAEKGKVGNVLSVKPKKMLLTVEGVRIQVRHTKKKAADAEGGILKKEGPIHYSNVLLVDKTGKPTRIGYRFEEQADGSVKKIRFAKTTNEAI